MQVSARCLLRLLGGAPPPEKLSILQNKPLGCCEETVWMTLPDQS